ncbi:MAG: class I mannose-6-phosphate isomerase [Bacteroidales bacterium]|nr:class I mannose-6-phosphate isomerase [Bacteroidales bacterium]
MLYPLKFTPILKSTIWGGKDICKFKQIEPLQSGIGESWEISQVPNSVSVVSNGEFEGTKLTDLIDQFKFSLLGKRVYVRFGKKFPLLIKFIDACDDLSIQVHPNDDLAAKRHKSFGKTEMWYIISAKKNAALFSGFKKKITPEEYVTSVKDNTFTGSLQSHSIKAGDVFFLPAGRVHAIGKGTFLAEIQQSSDVTYRIFDYNRKDAYGQSRELHTELAKDAIDYELYDNLQTNYTKVDNFPVNLASCQYFVSNLLAIDEKIARNNIDKDSFIIYMCMKGKVKITDSNGFSIQLNKGETTLIPASIANVTITPDIQSELLETYIP